MRFHVGYLIRNITHKCRLSHARAGRLVPSRRRDPRRLCMHDTLSCMHKTRVIARGGGSRRLAGAGPGDMAKPRD